MPNNQRIHFPNTAGESLAASLGLPDRPQPKAYILFAHCFTCGKDIAAASRISRSLIANGFAVLRFDFTGLGGSEGDFANTNFSSNVEDLQAAADFLRSHYQAPAVLIGHSLGGTAILAVAEKIAECRAVITIGAPASPSHVLKRIGIKADDFSADGEKPVSIAGRDFRLKKQFVEDLEKENVTDRIGRLKRALLVFHSPVDDIVDIEEAGRIFQAAKHPKSFVSLDSADHLLSRLADAQYVADTISAWVARYLPVVEEPARANVAGGEVRVGEVNARFLRQIETDDHAWLADEPKQVGGDNLGPDPYEHLLAALGACTSMTIRMYANHKGLALEDVDVDVTHRREHAQDCENCEGSGARIDIIGRRIKFRGDLTMEQIDRLLEIANRCPVHRTLEGDIRIETEQG